MDEDIRNHFSGIDETPHGTLVHDIARQLGALIDGYYYDKNKGKGPAGNCLEWAALTKENGQRIMLRYVFETSRIEFSAVKLVGTDGWPKPIGIGAHRPIRQIAADVIRRLVEPYDKAWQAHIELVRTSERPETISAIDALIKLGGRRSEIDPLSVVFGKNVIISVRPDGLLVHADGLDLPTAVLAMRAAMGKS